MTLTMWNRVNVVFLFGKNVCEWSLGSLGRGCFFPPIGGFPPFWGVFDLLRDWNRPKALQTRPRKGHFSPSNWLPEWTLFGEECTKLSGLGVLDKTWTVPLSNRVVHLHRLWILPSKMISDSPSSWHISDWEIYSGAELTSWTFQSGVTL